MKKIASFIIATFLGATVATAAFPSGVTYAGSCEKTFLGMRPWYMGLTESKADSTGASTCVIKGPDDDKDGTATSAEMANFVWKIALNIMADISLMVGYVAIAFVVWGGYKYIMSNGEPGNVATAKKTITNALIGLVIAILSTVIVNTIIVVVNGAVA